MARLIIAQVHFRGAGCTAGGRWSAVSAAQQLSNNSSPSSWLQDNP